MSVTALRSAPPKRKRGDYTRKRRRDVERVLELYGRGVGLDTIARELHTTLRRVGSLLEEGLSKQPEIEPELLREAEDLRLARLSEAFAAVLDDPDAIPAVRVAAGRGLLATTQTRQKLWGLHSSPKEDA